MSREKLSQKEGGIITIELHGLSFRIVHTPIQQVAKEGFLHDYHTVYWLVSNDQRPPEILCSLYPSVYSFPDSNWKVEIGKIENKTSLLVISQPKELADFQTVIEEVYQRTVQPKLAADPDYRRYVDSFRQPQQGPSQPNDQEQPKNEAVFINDGMQVAGELIRSEKGDITVIVNNTRSS